ncbi:hypothetical protein [Cytobacillus firmus]|uniref:hypothetical protein n=1 Tax=Cytobacillus firmus TaxID=1399 RepID=UPI003001C2E7
MKNFIEKCNTDWHKRSLYLYAIIVLGHWLEHIFQVVQIHSFHMETHNANGFLGMYAPWLVKSEWLHTGYAWLMIIGLIILRKGFMGLSKSWWILSLTIQAWHVVEHSLLSFQAITGISFFGYDNPTSVLQLIIPRVELHLFYNSIVTVPMVIAMLTHMFPSKKVRANMKCTCALKF